ncbi:MAG: tyrosine-type recombinase/integrase [Spirochaetia bacterium]|nr:tyrosine-type recombinase/integrase [Spirochaetia bacterium]
MKTKREPFLLYQRNIRKTGKKASKNLSFYVKYRNDEGILIPAVSTRQRTSAAATAWAIANRDRIVGKSYERKGDPLGELLTTFYADGSKMLKRRADRGEPISEEYRIHCEGYCKNHFIPFFIENDIRSVHDVRRSLLRDMQDYMRDKNLSAKTVNSALSALRVIFDYLMEEEKIANNPCYGLKPLVVQGQEERGTLPLDKVQSVFKMEWSDNRSRLLCELGACCGLRNSEINALRVSSIVEANGHHYLDVKNAHNATRNTKTEAGKRRIPLLPQLVAHLKKHIEIMGLAEADYLFWEHREGKLQSLPPKVFGQAVIDAAMLLGLSEKYLNDNNITFYGWRHFYNSLLITAGINPYRVKVLMGHSLGKGNDMTANYYKQIADDTEEVLTAVSTLFN